MSTIQHGDSVESWTIHSHCVLVICPSCRRPLSRPHSEFYKIDFPHTFGCDCGQWFGIKWNDKTQNAQVTIHEYVDFDVDEEQSE